VARNAFKGGMWLQMRVLSRKVNDMLRRQKKAVGNL